MSPMQPPTSIDPDTPVAMTVAGSDSGGGAGIQADLLTFEGFGVHGTSAITCLTAQNPDSVSEVFPATAPFVLEKMQQLARYFEIRALKTGMLFSEEIIRTVAGFLEEHPEIPAVVDPVMVATSGAVLLQEAAIDSVKRHLLPRAALITPNLDEAAVLAGERAADTDAMVEAGRRLCAEYGCAVLMKGGHLEGERVIDVLIAPGEEPRRFDYSRVREVNTHGSGCLFSAAITAGLSLGYPLGQAVARARAFLQAGMNSPKSLGGRRFINPSAKPASEGWLAAHSRIPPEA